MPPTAPAGAPQARAGQLPGKAAGDNGKSKVGESLLLLRSPFYFLQGAGLCWLGREDEKPHLSRRLHPPTHPPPGSPRPAVPPPSEIPPAWQPSSCCCSFFFYLLLLLHHLLLFFLIASPSGSDRFAACTRRFSVEQEFETASPRWIFPGAWGNPSCLAGSEQTACFWINVCGENSLTHLLLKVEKKKDWKMEKTPLFPFSRLWLSSFPYVVLDCFLVLFDSMLL